MFQHYISRTFGGDLQSIILGREQHKDTMNLLRSMELTRDRRAPKVPNSELTKSGVRVRGKTTSAHDYEVQRAQRKKQLSCIRQQFFKNPVPEALSESWDIMDTDEDKPQKGPEPSRCLTALLRYDHPRRAIVQNFYQRKTKEPLPLGEALEPLVNIAKPGAWFACYPRAAAEDDECPVCTTQFRPK